MSRDPRTDPRPGDVLESGNTRFYVARVENGVVYYTYEPPPDEMSVDIEEWRLNSAKDVVITQAK